jgi:sugar phosphate isomerase/epimerase
VPEATKRPLSLAALTILEVPPAEAIRIAARCGYSHVGLRPVAATPEEPQWPILSDRSLRNELAATLKGEGIQVLDTEIVRIKPEMDWSLLETVLAFSQEFAATRLLVADNDPDADRSRDSLARLGEMARPFGVTPHLEFMPWTCTQNIRVAKERVARLKNIALLIDAFHLVRSGGSVDEIDWGDTAIGYLQLCDIAGPVPEMEEILRQARSDRLFPGEGEIDLVGLLQRLPDIPISLEIPADRLRDAGWTAEARAKRAIEATMRILNTADADA